MKPIFLVIYCGFGHSIFSSCFSEHRSDVGDHCQEQPSPDLERGGSTVWSRGLGGGGLSGSGGGFGGSYSSHRKLKKIYISIWLKFEMSNFTDIIRVKSTMQRRVAAVEDFIMVQSGRLATQNCLEELIKSALFLYQY